MNTNVPGRMRKALKSQLWRQIKSIAKAVRNDGTSIFISYRRGDAIDVTGRIRDRLVHKFDESAVFTDVDNIPYGINFVQFIDNQVTQCDVFLAIIGRDWLTAEDENGNRRLDNPNDFVRLEIESALKQEIPVIPVLVSSAKMPTEEQLPETLQELALRNGLSVRPDPDFNRDMDRLITSLQEHLGITIQAQNLDKSQLSQNLDKSQPYNLGKSNILAGAALGLLMGIVSAVLLPSSLIPERVNKEEDFLSGMIFYWILFGSIVGALTRSNKHVVSGAFAGSVVTPILLWIFLPAPFLLIFAFFLPIGAMLGAILTRILIWMNS